MDLFREFDNGLAVVLDGDGIVIRQLVAFETTRSGKVQFAQPDAALKYPTKKLAAHFCKQMHWPVDHIQKARDIGGTFWFIQYDWRTKYALACWEV